MIKNIALLIIGAGIGSAVTYKIVKDKYEMLIEEEIESVKDAFSNMSPRNTNREVTEEDLQRKSELAKEARNKVSVDEYAKIVNERYAGTDTTNEENEEDTMTDKPYLIDSDEFGEFDTYDEVALVFYADNILAEDLDDDSVIDDVDGIVGKENLKLFDKEGIDTMYIRNDARMTDYEVVRDLRTYEEVCGTNVYGADIEED